MNTPAGSFAVLGVVLSAALGAQDTSPTNTFKEDQLDQMVAPIALYPDALVAQMLMASTYPLEVVQADRWLDERVGAEAIAIDEGLKAQAWDPAVKALVKVPEILDRMSRNLDWTRELGDAFLGQKDDLLEAIQRMRKWAKDGGNLQTTPQQGVMVEGSGAIVIEQVDPEVIYVPDYGTAVYGDGWTYGAGYYPSLYGPGARLLEFAAARRVGDSLWGRVYWRNHDVTVNVNQYNGFNQLTTRDFRAREPVEAGWSHDVEHRRGVGYRDPAVENRYRSPQPNDVARGRVASPSDRTYLPNPQGGTPRGGRDRPDNRPDNPVRDHVDRGNLGGGNRGGGFEGAGSPRADRAASQRGSRSRGGEGGAPAREGGAPAGGAARRGGGGGRRR